MAESLTSCEENAFSELRLLLNDISDDTYKDTSVLLKFLIDPECGRAASEESESRMWHASRELPTPGLTRDFNVKQAEFMIRKNIRWKKEMQIDTFLTDFKPPEVLEKYLSASYIGFDKDGYLVVYLPLGNIDGKGIFKSANSICCMEFYTSITLKILKIQESQSKKMGKPLTKSVYIYNAENLSLAKLANVQSFQSFLKYIVIFQDNFPETIKEIYVINAPAFYIKFWPVVKKLLGSSLLNKINFYGKNGWKEKLLELMDADQLPAFLGGNRTDPDGNPLCLTFINHLSDPVPKKYFLEKDIEKMARKPGVKSARIDRQSCIAEALEIRETNSIIHWEFELKHYDIGFGILIEKTDGISEELIPVHKIQTELEPYMGMYRCEKLGKHLMIFDNSYSWIHPKEIYYRIWVTNVGAT